MKKHSLLDKAFMHSFAAKLFHARDRAKRIDGVSFEKFAELLGVTRAGLHKYLKEKSVPSLDVLERARSLGVEVKYGELNVDMIKRRAKKDPASPEAQMILPLALENLTDQNISVELAPKKPNAIELNVTIRFSKKNARR
ncbi:MAG: helix-turn-helix transcriptional regulator [Candidatus Sulfotelmatobacter sp.]